MSYVRDLFVRYTGGVGRPFKVAFVDEEQYLAYEKTEFEDLRSLINFHLTSHVPVGPIEVYREQRHGNCWTRDCLVTLFIAPDLTKDIPPPPPIMKIEPIDTPFVKPPTLGSMMGPALELGECKGCDTGCKKFVVPNMFWASLGENDIPCFECRHKKGSHAKEMPSIEKLSLEEIK